MSWQSHLRQSWGVKVHLASSFSIVSKDTVIMQVAGTTISELEDFVGIKNCLHAFADSSYCILI